jgi:hypothetical protein
VRSKGGKLILTGPDDKVRYVLSPSEGNTTIEAGAYKVRIEGADGLAVDTPEFTLEKGGKITVRVTVVPKATMKASDLDRKAAQWVLSLGGTVRVSLSGQEREIRAAAELPRESFRLTWVDLRENKQVDDAGLARLKGCKNLAVLYLWRTKVGNAGMAHFKDCKSLTALHLGGTQVSEPGLASFKDCKGLRSLYLWGTQVSDAALAHFKDCNDLTELGLGGTKVGDKGLAHFKDCKSLKVLDLSGTQVSDAGLASFKDCKSLRELYLNGTKVSDAGLSHFKDCKGLTHLNLNGTQVSDAGLASFKGCTKLTYLDLSGTKVSDLSPLLGKPLKDLRCDFKAARDTKVLRSMPTLEKINGKPVKQFWQELDAKMP